MYEEAESLLRESLEIRKREEPEFWTTFDTMSMLGGALLGQGKFDEIDRLLIDGYEGLENHAEKIPSVYRIASLANAVDRLVQLAEKTGHDDDLARWRKERALYQEN